MDTKRLKEIKQILSDSYGEDRFEITGGIVTIHFPELWIRRGKKSIKGLDYWVRFTLKSDGTLKSGFLELQRTTHCTTDHGLHCHPHGGGVGNWGVTCQGGSQTPINQVTGKLCASYSKQIFMAFLADLKSFLEYDNYGGVIAAMEAEAFRNHPALSPIDVDEDVVKEVLQEAAKSKEFKRSIKFNEKTNKVSISESGLEVVTDILMEKGYQHLLVVSILNEDVGENSGPIEVRNTGSAGFKFRGETVYLKRVNYIHDEKQKRQPRKEFIKQLTSAIRKRILEKISGGKKTKVQGSRRNRSKTSKSNNSLVSSGS